MITKLQNNDVEMAKKIRSIFYASYQVEANLIGATDFPPLKRTIESYRNSSTEFFGYFRDRELVGVVEIEHKTSVTDINSLVVDPNYFRQGIARKLLEFAFDSFKTNLFIVETGLENKPAIELYKKFNFQEVKQWQTDFGIRKVKFERRFNK